MMGARALPQVVDKSGILLSIELPGTSQQVIENR
jgi:hypothetical protein